jgi:hypothetical protein
VSWFSLLVSVAAGVVFSFLFLLLIVIMFCYISVVAFLQFLVTFFNSYVFDFILYFCITLLVRRQLFSFYRPKTGVC